ncbi:MAG: ferrous iron transport protein A [Oscillospiraceae bacterium]|jgi:ferrous iron transport protein A|nr:ferrous iron transport protein A [Oscillospiraceae bacterium]
MEVALTLDQLAVGRSAAIAALSAPESQRRRLLDLGFVPGSAVTAVQESPWGDPVAYAVCGAVIALRRADARGIGIYPA